MSEPVSVNTPVVELNVPVIVEVLINASVSPALKPPIVTVAPVRFVVFAAEIVSDDVMSMGPLCLP